MGLIITSSINLSIGEAKTDVYGVMVFDTSKMLIAPYNVGVTLNFYKSEADLDAGKSQVIPIDSNGSPITNCVIECLVTDVIKESGQSTLLDVVTYFYTKVKAKLETDYGWTIVL